IEERAGLLKVRDRTAMEEVIHRSAALHLHHIATAGDPFEMGSSRALDFGHWAAHKLERLTNHQLRHGEAVAIGLALDTTYSYLSGFLAEGDWRRVIGLLTGLGLPRSPPRPAPGRATSRRSCAAWTNSASTSAAGSPSCCCGRSASPSTPTRSTKALCWAASKCCARWKRTGSPRSR